MDLRYPSQKEWQRKEQLYLKIIEYFEKDKQWEDAIPLCKELAVLYEKKVFDYVKLASILKRTASLFEKIISSDEEGLRFDPEYFRVGFYGQGFPLFLRVSFRSSPFHSYFSTEKCATYFFGGGKQSMIRFFPRKYQSRNLTYFCAYHGFTNKM